MSATTLAQLSTELAAAVQEGADAQAKFASAEVDLNAIIAGGTQPPQGVSRVPTMTDLKAVVENMASGTQMKFLV